MSKLALPDSSLSTVEANNKGSWPQHKLRNMPCLHRLLKPFLCVHAAQVTTRHSRPQVPPATGTQAQVASTGTELPHLLCRSSKRQT
jgi:hypothetical protein